MMVRKTSDTRRSVQSEKESTLTRLAAVRYLSQEDATACFECVAIMGLLATSCTVDSPNSVVYIHTLVSLGFAIVSTNLGLSFWLTSL